MVYAFALNHEMQIEHELKVKYFMQEEIEQNEFKYIIDYI